MRCFDLRMGRAFDHYGLKSGMVFKGTKRAMDSKQCSLQVDCIFYSDYGVHYFDSKILISPDVVKFPSNSGKSWS